MDLSLFEYDPKATLAQLTNDMIETYRQEDSIHHLGYCPLPNYRVIVETLEDLKDVLFPGYRRKEGDSSSGRRRKEGDNSSGCCRSCACRGGCSGGSRDSDRIDY